MAFIQIPLITVKQEYCLEYSHIIVLAYYKYFFDELS